MKRQTKMIEKVFAKRRNKESTPQKILRLLMTTSGFSCSLKKGVKPLRKPYMTNYEYDLWKTVQAQDPIRKQIPIEDLRALQAKILLWPRNSGPLLDKAELQKNAQGYADILAKEIQERVDSLPLKLPPSAPQ